MAPEDEWVRRANAPFGYAKNPVAPRKSRSPQSTGRPPQTLARGGAAPASSPQSDGSKARALDSLPPEIASSVADHLSQYDCLSLAATSRTMHVTCMPRLLHKVVVDPSYTEFSPEYAPHCTYINLLYSFRRFVRAGPLVQTLWVEALPDLACIDGDTAHALMDFFRLQESLAALIWRPPTFNWEWLARLPQPENLLRLDICMALLHLPRSEASLHAQFCNLDHLRLHVPLTLAQWARLEGGCEHLRALCVDRSTREPTALLPPSRDLAAPDFAAVDVDTIRKVFATPRPTLLALTLSNVLVCEDDALRLAQAVCLPQLEYFALHGVAECGARTRDGFLPLIAPQVTNLRALHLDFREGAQDTVAAFLAAIATAPLTELDLVVRLNEIKLSFADADTIYSTHARALAAFSLLTKLSIEVRQESAFCDLTVPTPEVLGRTTGGMRLLRSLRLSVPTLRTLAAWLAPLERLQYLDVFGVRAGGAPNLGLGMVHPNVFDEWFKVQHAAQLYAEARPSLLYVRINQCVFDFSGADVNPRDGIDRWFDLRVRVG